MDTTLSPLATIGVDIGKEVFHIVGLSTDGRIAFRRKIKRLALVETFKKLPPGVVGMEACRSAHFVSRTLRQLGHRPRSTGSTQLADGNSAEPSGRDIAADERPDHRPLRGLDCTR